MSSPSCGARQALVAAWEGVVASAPDRCTLTDERDSATYTAAALDAASLALAGLITMGESEKRVAAIGVSLSPGAAEAVVVLAALRSGTPWVPLPSATVMAAESLVWLGARVSVLVCDEASAADFESIAAGRALFVLKQDGSVARTLPGCFIRQDNEPVPARPSKRSRGDGSSSARFFEDDILYVMRTSGSTGGDVKFVQGRASSTLNRLMWQWRSMPFAAADCHSSSVVCRRSPLVFVDSIAEIFGTLLGGAMLFVPASTIVSDPARFIAACRTGQVSRITLVPSLLECVLNSLPRLHKCAGKKIDNSSTQGGILQATLPLLTEWIVSGEAVTRSHIDAFSAAAGGGISRSVSSEPSCFMPSPTLGSVRLINLYGSTEIAADVTACVVAGPALEGLSSNNMHQLAFETTDEGLLTCADARRSAGVPVGFAIDGVELDVTRLPECIRDRQGQKNVSSSESTSLAPGIQGEIVVRGIMVADGYCPPLNTLVHGHAVNGRFGISGGGGEGAHEQKRWFRTGDVGFRCRDCGNVYLVGRADNQVKIRGVRLSLEEAEEALRGIMTGLGLSNMISVVAHKLLSKTTGDSSLRLVAFVADASSEEDASSTAASISKAAARLLPGYFVPSIVLAIDSLPRNGSGKIDRRALVASLDKTSGSVVTNTDELSLQQWLISVMGVLLRAKCSPAQYLSNSFHELGGDSLMAIELAWRCGEEVNRRRAASDSKTLIEVVAVAAPTAAEVLSSPLLELCKKLEDAVVGVSVSSPPGTTGLSILPASQLHLLGQQGTRPPGPSMELLRAPSPGNASSWLTRAGLGSGSALFPLIVPPVKRGLQDARLAVRWRLNLGRCVDASALVVQNAGGAAPATVYIGAHSRIVAACEAATGVELWRREVVDAGAPRIGDDAAIEATAAVSVDGAVLLVACYDGSLVALCAETGAELWRCRAEAEIKGAPLVYAPPSEASLPSALATQAPPPRPSLSSSSSSSSSLNFPGPSSSTRGFAPSVYTGCAFFGAHDAAVRCVFVGAALVSPEGSSGSTTSTNSSSNNSSSGAPLLSPEADASRTPGAVWWRFDVDGAVYASLALARAESWEHPRRAKGGGKGGIGSSGHGGGRQGTAAQFIVTGTGTDAAPGTVAELLLTATTKGTLYAHFLGTLEILASNGAGDEESSSSSRDGNNGGGGAPAAPTMAWRYAAGAPLFATPAVHTPLNLAVCATVGGRVVGVSLRDGSPRWVCLAGRAVFSSPALSRASPARASSASGAEDEEAEAEARVVVGCHDGTLSCRTVASGRRVWTTHLAEACRAGPLLLPKLPKLFELPGLRNPSVPTAERAEAGSSSGGSSHSDNNNNGSSSAAAAAPASDGAYAEPAVPPEVPAEDPIFAAPFVFSEGSFSGGGGCGRGKSLVCAASQSGLVAVLDLATGEALAALRLPGQIFSSPVVLAAAAAGDASARTHHIILIGCRDDHLYALDFLA